MRGIVKVGALCALGAAAVAVVSVTDDGKDVAPSRRVRRLGASVTNRVPLATVDGATSTASSSAPLAAVETVSAVADSVTAYAAIETVSGASATDSAVLALAEARGLDPADVAKVYVVLASVEGTTADQVESVLALAEARGLDPADVKAILALAPAEVQSRFDIVRGAMFSRVWAIRLRAREMEKRGENTDALWKAYLELVSRAMENEKDED